jgi:uncharacterized membrane protein
VRQAQRLPRAFGVLLQLAAGLAFASTIGHSVGDTLFLNSAYLGAAFLGIAGVFTASLIGRHRQTLTRFEPALGAFLLLWGVIWWLAGGFRELSWYTPGEGRFEATNLGEHFFLIYAAASAALLTFIAGRRDWREGVLPAFALLPIAALTLLQLDVNWVRDTAFADFGWLAWPVVFAVGYWHLRQVPLDSRLAALWHALSWWFLTVFLTWNSAALAKIAGDFVTGSVWVYVIWGAVPLLVSLLVVKLEYRSHWPFDAYPGAYFGWGWTVSVAYLAGWLLATGFVRGDADPIPYLVLINPIELVQAGILLLGVKWLRRLPEGKQSGLEQIGRIGLGALAFFWINTVVARAVHYYADVPYPIDRIVESDAFLTTVTILWTVIALVLMGYATRRTIRSYWMVGAGLLGVVIVKLFLVDMGNLALIGRIVTFISVGVLMLVIGYFAPLPPRVASAGEEENVEAAKS